MALLDMRTTLSRVYVFDLSYELYREKKFCMRG